MRIVFVALLSTTSLLFACSGDDKSAQVYEVNETRTAIAIGQQVVDLVVFESEAPGLSYINLHDNEQTSVEAALDLLSRRGGKVFELQHGGVRNISFTLDGQSYTFDPNRMFTDAGAKGSLERHSQYTPEAHAEVRAFAEQALAAYGLAQLDAVITLHNTPKDASFTILNYVAGGSSEQAAAAVNLADAMNPGDYFFVTDAIIYDAFAAAGFNVVLQDNAGVTDDGSLSVFCAQNDLPPPYINAEATAGHLVEQTAMLDAAADLVMTPGS